MDYDFQEFLEVLKTSTSQNLIWDKLVAYTRNAGVCQLSTWFISGPDSINFLATIPAWWEEHYHATNALSFDHVVRHALYNSGPLIFGYEQDKHNRNLSEETLNLLKMTSAELNFNSGICIPSFHGNKRIGGIGLSFQESVTELRSIPAILPLQLQLACCTAHERLYTLKDAPSNAPSLTPRQKECLTWLAAGLTPQEIADKIGISYHTVKMHLDTATKRLGATNKIQAVAKALILSLINFD